LVCDNPLWLTNSYQSSRKWQWYSSI
jgi:hypothetical protein